MADKNKSLLDELKKLSIEERIKKLRELEKEKEKELKETRKILNNALFEIEKKKEREKEQIEEQNNDDADSVQKDGSISDLIETEELRESLQKSSSDEEDLSKAYSVLNALNTYNNPVKVLGTNDVYNVLKTLYYKSQQGEYWNEVEQEAFEAIKNNLMSVAVDYNKTPDEVLDNIVSSRKVLKQLGYKADWWKS